ncbi:hypothetical protein JOD29_003746 [Lysinibacillus composti]|nr:hypothetical protein [Lysinibacillus composti]
MFSLVLYSHLKDGYFLNRIKLVFKSKLFVFMKDNICGAWDEI